MCLILIALQQHSRYPLVIAANRDEYFSRPAAPADFWTNAPQLLAGRDLQAGGTWLGITRSGRFAAVTNVREPGRQRSDARSRGDLTTGFLTDTRDPLTYLAQLQAEADAYNGFNLICGTPDSLFHYSNRAAVPVRLQAGLHGVSNHLLDTPWPKLVSGKQALGDLVSKGEFSLDDLLPVLDHREPAPPHLLPDTGVGSLMESVLSSRFIHAPAMDYGTRVSTALRVDARGRVEWQEWTWDRNGQCIDVRRHGFELIND